LRFAQLSIYQSRARWEAFYRPVPNRLGHALRFGDAGNRHTMHNLTEGSLRGKMRSQKTLAAAALAVCVVGSLTAQQPPPGTPPGGGRGGRGAGGFVPGQQRRPEDPAQVERGKTVYGISCTGCHGADLRGGDMGGPNLLRSQVAISDQNGELIVPIIQGSRQNSGMPPIQMSPEDAKATAAYVRSIMETIGRQGMPPEVGLAPTN